jgi:hypothetical protein
MIAQSSPMRRRSSMSRAIRKLNQQSVKPFAFRRQIGLCIQIRYDLPMTQPFAFSCLLPVKISERILPYGSGPSHNIFSWPSSAQ